MTYKSNATPKAVLSGLASALLLAAGLLVAPGANAASLFPQPEAITSPVSTQQLNEVLATQKKLVCADLARVGAIIVSTGILSDVPKTISQMANMPISQLEVMETSTCQPSETAQEAKTTADLLNELRQAQWLMQMHLVAMDRVLMAKPTYRPVNAEGSFRALFELHDIAINALRSTYLNLVNEPTIENARAMVTYIDESLIPHAKAEEVGLFRMAESLDDPELTHSSQLVEQEHRTIDALIEEYKQTLSQVESGQASMDALIPIALNLRLRSELHFAKEEESVVRPMQQKLTSEEFMPVIEEYDQQFGQWLRQRGWQWPNELPESESPESGAPAPESPESAE